MKKIAVIIFINFFVIFLLLISFEFIAYKQAQSLDHTGWFKTKKFLRAYSFLPIKNFETQYQNFLDGKNYKIYLRPEIKGDETKPPIMILGCSFAFGGDLEANETLGSQINLLTNRTVDNFATPGGGLNQTLYMLKKGIPVKVAPEYIIYVYIGDHKWRLFSPCSFFDDDILMFYKYDKQGKIKQRKDRDILWWHSYILRKNNRIFWNREILRNNMRPLMFLKDMILEIKNTANKEFKDSKFIFFVFDGDEDIKKIENDLRNDNITVVYLSELSNINLKEKKYLSKDNIHPSALVWKEITPLLLKKLNIN